MDSEKIKEEFGYKGKPKQWQVGFDALLKHMPDYLKANKEPVAKLQIERGVIKAVYDLDEEELIERLENIEFAVALFLIDPIGRNKERLADLTGRDLQGKPL